MAVANISTLLDTRAVTATVYGLIRDKRYLQALAILNSLLALFPNSRAALSLLAYCQYHSQDYQSSSGTYFKLMELCPDSDEYKLYYAQSMYKAGEVDLAADILATMKFQTEQSRHLSAVLKFDSNEKSIPVSPDLMNHQKLVLEGCQLYRNKAYSKAKSKFQEAAAFVGWRPYLLYNSTVCDYQLGNFRAASAAMDQLIGKVPRDITILVDGFVSNSEALKNSCLIEAFNLKAASHFKLGNLSSCADCIGSMPPRLEEDLDPVSLHNSAVFSAQGNPAEAIKKLDHLLTLSSKPTETIANFVLICLRSDAFDLAADALGTHPELAAQLSADFLDFSEAVVLCLSSPEDANRKLSDLSRKIEAQLAKAAAAIQDARGSHGPEDLRKKVAGYDAVAGKLLPVVMWKAKVYWELRDYARAEQILREYTDFFADEDSWKINIGHALFMQEHFPEAIQFYEPIVEASLSAILSLPAILVANLCVSYVLTNQNAKAENLMKQINLAEQSKIVSDPSASCFHLCTSNLVIGNLYCSRGNYDFGITRVIKAFDLIDRKLGDETWLIAKRCLLAYASQLAGRLIVAKDETISDIYKFLDAVIVKGKTLTGDPTLSKGSISSQARAIKASYLNFR